MGSKCHVPISRVLCIVVLLICSAIAGGILLWQYIPDNQKDTISDIAGTIQIPNGSGDGNSVAPPSNYTFQQCDIPNTDANSTDCCNGLVGLCDYGIDDILMGGIHNAHSTVADGYFVVPNHQYNVIAALEYGYRTLNFDIGVCNENELRFVHGSCQLPTSDIVTTLSAIHTWLNDNPNEVLVLPLQIVNELDAIVDLTVLYTLMSTVANGDFVNQFYQKLPNEPWPPLRTMIANQQRIVVFQYNAKQSCSAGLYSNSSSSSSATTSTTNGGETPFVCPRGFHDWFGFTGESRFDFKNEEDLFNDKESACNITRGRTKGPLYAINVFLSIPSKSTQSTMLNTKSFLQDHIAICSVINNGLDVNVVFVDFWSEGNLPEVVQIHNKDLISQRRRRRGRKRERQLLL